MAPSLSLPVSPVWVLWELMPSFHKHLLNINYNPIHVAYLCLPRPLSPASHSGLTHEYNLATKRCPGTTLLRGPDSLFLRLRVSTCLLPFLQTFSEDILCADPYIFLFVPTTQRFLHLWLHLSHSPSLSLFSLCVLISLIFLFFSLSLSFSLPDCVCLFQVSFYFSHSLSISTPSCPPQVCLSLQAWSLARHKSPSLQPHGSHYHSLSKVCWPLRGPLTLHYASFSISFFSHCLCRPLSGTYSLFGCMYVLLSLCLSPSVLPVLSVSPCYYCVSK